MTFSGSPVTFTVGVDEQLEVEHTLTSAVGCVSSARETFGPGSLSPFIDIINTAGGDGDCMTTDTYTFSPSISGIPVGSSITSFLWTDSNGNTFTTENIDIILAPGETVELDLVVTYANGCVFSSSENGSNGGGGPFIFTPDFAADLDITPQVDCTSQGASTEVVLTDNTINTSPITSQVWTINGVPQTALSVLTFAVGTADVVITYDVTYANGCTASFSQTYNGNALIPTQQDAAAIESEVLSCNGDQITISFSGGANSGNFCLLYTSPSPRDS